MRLGVTRALFSLADEEGRIEEVRHELELLADLLDQNGKLRNAIFRPLHPVAERRAVLQSVSRLLGASETVRKFFAFLIDKRRLIDFDSIHGEFGRLADLAAGRTKATVVSASPLGDDECGRLRRALGARTGQEIDLEVSVDPSLLGGVIAAVGNLVFDGSLRTQLTHLRASLMKGL